MICICINLHTFIDHTDDCEEEEILHFKYLAVLELTRIGFAFILFSTSGKSGSRNTNHLPLTWSLITQLYWRYRSGSACSVSTIILIYPIKYDIWPLRSKNINNKKSPHQLYFGRSIEGHTHNANGYIEWSFGSSTNLLYPIRLLLLLHSRGVMVVIKCLERLLEL